MCCVDAADGGVCYFCAPYHFLTALWSACAQASGCSGRLHGVSSDDTSVQCSGIWVSQCVPHYYSTRVCPDPW